MEFEHKGVVYIFDELTLGQMEILSGLMTGAKDKLKASLNGAAPTSELEVAISLNDVIDELRRERKLARFVAVCVVQKGKGFDESVLADMEKSFKNLPYKIVEEILAFFFNTGIFAKIVTPSFLMLQNSGQIKSKS